MPSLTAPVITTVAIPSATTSASDPTGKSLSLSQGTKRKKGSSMVFESEDKGESIGEGDGDDHDNLDKGKDIEGQKKHKRVKVSVVGGVDLAEY